MPTLRSMRRPDFAMLALVAAWTMVVRAGGRSRVQIWPEVSTQDGAARKTVPALARPMRDVEAVGTVGMEFDGRLADGADQKVGFQQRSHSVPADR